MRLKINKNEDKKRLYKRVKKRLNGHKNGNGHNGVNTDDLRKNGTRLEGRDSKGRFIPGNEIGIRGRPRGIPNRITILRDSVLDELNRTLQSKDTVAINSIRRCLRESPQHVLNLVGRLLPRDIHIDVEQQPQPVVIAPVPIPVHQTTAEGLAIEGRVIGGADEKAP